MKDNRKISHFSSEKLDDAVGEYALVDEPSIIIKTSETEEDLSRLAYEINYKTDYDDNYNIVKSVVALYPQNSYLYELDSGTELEFDDEEGTAKFSSSGHEYFVRAIQPDDGDLWDLLQRWNRFVDPQNNARS